MSERFDLSNYKTVAERIAEARQAYPDGRFQSEIVHWDGFGLAVKARFFRGPDDPTPGEGMAWEPVPGRTPYTKDSELQNAETSAWGRALVAALVVDASKGIASREEVRNRREAPAPPADEEMKRWTLDQMARVLDAVGGNREAAKEHWDALLRANDLDPRQVPSRQHKEVLETEIALLITELAGLMPVDA